MKRGTLFLVMTVGITAILGAFFVVLVGAPEPWQDQPWTVWERGAQVLFPILGWPIVAGTLLLGSVGGSMPDSVTKTFIVLLFLASGAFWAAAIRLISARSWKKITPNQASHATSEHVPDAGSSAHEG